MPLQASRSPAGFLLAVASANFATVVCALPSAAALRLVPDKAEATASRIDTTSENDVARSSTGKRPPVVAVGSGGRRAGGAHADLISSVDLRTWKVTGHLQGGQDADGLGWSL